LTVVHIEIVVLGTDLASSAGRRARGYRLPKGFGLRRGELSVGQKSY
jgi:hypothetical protein